MKNLSIRLRITLWFTFALVVNVAITYFLVLRVSDNIIQKTIKDSLVETVEHNVDEVEFYASLEEIETGEDIDHYIEYDTGYLEIDDDFLDEVNDVYTALYNEDGTLIYGENPVAKASGDVLFSDSEITKIKVNGTTYYIFDKKLNEEGLGGLWLRGVVSELQGEQQISDIMRNSLILMPAIVLLAAIGGYFLARKMLRPVNNISNAAIRIGKERNLKERIDIGEGKDELHKLADTINGMFEQLDDAFEAERQFSSDVSHELRTPVAVIMAQCEYSLQETQTEEEYKEALEVIQRQGRKMSGMVNDLLTFTRLERKADIYVKEDIDLAEIVTSVCADMAMIKHNGITLTWETGKNVVVHGNLELLTRLVENLISNAYKYGKENGKIAVSVETEEDNVKLTVYDDGIGIKEEDIKKIFRRFYQADTAHSGAGSGLGLAMVQEIAEFHSGRIDVESSYGKGSTFIFTMPANKA